MNVTEQLDALRVMGVDPIRYLVVPRFIACVLLTPVLTIYSDFLGVLGGWFISVFFLQIPNGPYWSIHRQGVDTWQIMEGIIKSFFFGGAIGLIACYKGFNSGSAPAAWDGPAPKASSPALSPSSSSISSSPNFCKRCT